MDGAGEFKQLRHIMLPQLWPVTVTCLILLLHTALKTPLLKVSKPGYPPARPLRESAGGRSSTTGGPVPRGSGST